jgi:hypothetical protein
VEPIASRAKPDRAADQSDAEDSENLRSQDLVRTKSGRNTAAPSR